MLLFFRDRLGGRFTTLSESAQASRFARSARRGLSLGRVGAARRGRCASRWPRPTVAPKKLSAYQSGASALVGDLARDQIIEPGEARARIPVERLAQVVARAVIGVLEEGGEALGRRSPAKPVIRKTDGTPRRTNG